MGFLTSTKPLEVGQEYAITLDGATYNCVAKMNDGFGMVYIGNAGLIGTGEDTGELFFIAPLGSEIELGIMINSDVLEHAVSIAGMISEVYKIDEKYLPDSLFEEKVGLSTTGTVYTIDGIEVTAQGGAEIFNDYSRNIAIGLYSHAEGYETTASGDRSHAEGWQTTASGGMSHAEGLGTTAYGINSHAEGQVTTASGACSHAEGFEAQAIGEASHAEGGYKFQNDKLMDAMIVDSYYYSKLTEEIIVKAPMAYGKQSHAEGSRTLAYGLSSHAEGDRSMAFGTASHAEGELACASGNYSHAEGYDTMASGDYSHTEGEGTIASGTSAHVEGGWTRALGDYQHAQGKNNIEDTENRYAHIVGNGESTLHRSNAHTLDWDGNAEFQGDVKANACGGENPISLVELYNTIQTLTERIAVLEAALNTDSLTETDANALVEEVFN